MQSRSLLTIGISNLRSVHVVGVGGLAMVATVVFTTMAIPLARWLLVGSALAGALAAVVVIRRRRHHVIGTPGDDLPMSLGLSDVGSQRLDSLMPADEPRPGAPRLAISY